MRYTNLTTYTQSGIDTHQQANLLQTYPLGLAPVESGIRYTNLTTHTQEYSVIPKYRTIELTIELSKYRTIELKYRSIVLKYRSIELSIEVSN